MSQTNDVGRAGEFLAAYILETYGIEVHHVDRDGADLWCKMPNRIVTVQVKAASTPSRSGSAFRRPYYTYLNRRVAADYFCFVALDLHRVLIRPASTVSRGKVRIHPSEFTEENQRISIKNMVAAPA